MSAADVFLARACNVLRTSEQRKLSWSAYEQERWYEAVHAGRLRLPDLEPHIAEAVYELIIQRNTLHAVMP